MKKNLLATVFLAVVIIGCSMADVERWAGKTKDGASLTEKAGTALAPFSAGYGTLLAGIASGVVAIASTVQSFAKSKKVDLVAKTASEAADNAKGGGTALVNAANKNGVAGEILKAYEGR